MWQPENRRRSNRRLSATEVIILVNGIYLNPVSGTSQGGEHDINATRRRFSQGGSAGKMKISKTDFQSNSVEAQCEACPLNQVEAGVAVRVKKLCVSHDIQVRLRELGFCEHQIIRLLAIQSNCICQVCNARLAISHKLAGSILVEPLRSPSKEVARNPLEAQWQ